MRDDNKIVSNETLNYYISDDATRKDIRRIDQELRDRIYFIRDTILSIREDSGEYNYFLPSDPDFYNMILNNEDVKLRDVYEEKSFIFPIRYLWEDFTKEETDKYIKTKKQNKTKLTEKTVLLNSIRTKLTLDEIKFLRENDSCMIQIFLFGSLLWIVSAMALGINIYLFSIFVLLCWMFLGQLIINKFCKKPPETKWEWIIIFLLNPMMAIIWKIVLICNKNFEK